MKFNRRRLLWTGLGLGTVAASTNDNLRAQNLRNQQVAKGLVGSGLNEHLGILEQAYDSETEWAEEVALRQKLLAIKPLTAPQQPYEREISKRLIQFCKLGVQQYKTGRANPNYDGSLRLLPAYGKALEGYTQRFNFTHEQDFLEDYLKYSSVFLDGGADAEQVTGSASELKLMLQDHFKDFAERKHKVPVYLGNVVTSKEHNILTFRGTQTQTEWLSNLNAAQVEWVSPDNQFYGHAHAGFWQITQNLKPSLKEIAQELDPNIPCYVTGHSLGAAIATLAAFELAQAAPQLKKQIRLYTYAGPRVCSPAFAKVHSQLIPNAYRIVNLSDSVPLVPPVTIGNSYTHIGEEWSFGVQYGDTLLNHIVDTYRTAIDQETEAKSGTAFPNLS